MVARTLTPAMKYAYTHRFVVDVSGPSRHVLQMRQLAIKPLSLILLQQAEALQGTPPKLCGSVNRMYRIAQSSCCHPTSSVYRAAEA